MRNLLRGAIVLTAIGGTLASGALPASANYIYTCSSVAYSCTPGYAGADGQYSYSEFAKVNKYGYPHNCTMYIAWLIDINLGWVPKFNLLGDASEWATSAAQLSSLGVSVHTTAKLWRIAQWDSGHVAFVSEVLKDPYGNVVRITVLEDNYSGTTSSRQITPGVGWPDHFIDFGLDFSQGLPGSGGGSGSSGIINLNSISLPN